MHRCHNRRQDLSGLGSYGVVEKNQALKSTSNSLGDTLVVTTDVV